MPSTKRKKMFILKFIKKPANEFASNFVGTYSKPTTCPHCGIGTDARIIDHKNFALENNTYLITASCVCTSCQKIFFFVCYKNKEMSDNAPLVFVYPNNQYVYKNPIIENFSPRFIDMYNQSLHSEINGDTELAAIGYRSALEILVKDYAINELGKPKEEVSGKKLFGAISEYLHQDDLVKTSDVIRILGNDFTHYERKYPQHDFNVLKGYLDIFIKQIEIQYMIKHPPVSRD